MNINNIKINLKLKLRKNTMKFIILERKIYNFIFSNNYNNREIYELIENKRFLELYEKFGENIYINNIKDIRESDLENEFGINIKFNNTLFFEKIKDRFRLVKKSAVKTILTLGIITPIVFDYSYDQQSKNFEKEYQSEINDYNNEIEKYAEYINSLNLSDFEVIIKVMNDMWQNVSYKNPDSYETIDNYRLSLYMNGYGVCRNMADDFTARLNAINPNFEAFNLNVNLNNCELNNIDRNLSEINNTTTNNQDNQESNKNIIGNHMVTCLKLNNGNIILVADPTNPSIGILKNGKICMLSDIASDGLEIKLIGSEFLNFNERNKFLETIIESYIKKSNVDVLKTKYGINSQNIVLEKIEEYSTENYNTKQKVLSK